MRHLTSWNGRNGKREKLRNLRHLCQDVLDSKDPQTIAAVERLKSFIVDDPQPEYALYHLLTKAKQSAIDIEPLAGEPVPVYYAIHHMINKFQGIMEPK